jgi:Universal stress protein UspA and related nucleotide-binding proteins
LTAFPRRQTRGRTYPGFGSTCAGHGHGPEEKAIQTERWIVVGTDFSSGAEQALQQALTLAAESNASIALVHAYEDTPGTLASNGQTAAALHARLEEAIGRTGARERGIRVDSVVRRGAPWDKIVNVASELGATLIVVGAHGQRGPMRSSLVGSVATRVVATSTHSVLVVRQ